MIPRLRERQPGIEQLPGAGNWYGTTLRIYDPALDAWRIPWNDPATNFFSQQIGRARGSDIVQTGPDPRGGTIRWVFMKSNRIRFTGHPRAPCVTTTANARAKSSARTGRRKRVRFRPARGWSTLSNVRGDANGQPVRNLIASRSVLAKEFCRAGVDSTPPRSSNR
jgi:hypothetical protein